VLGSTTATSGNLLIGQGATGWLTEPVTGDVTITNGGVTTIGAGRVTSADLANTAVSPAAYGSATQVGTFTVNQQGQLTLASNVTIAGTAPGGAAGGDLTGSSYPNPTVAAINGATLGSTTATAGNLLIGQGGSWVTEPVTGDVTITSAGVTSIGAGAVTPPKISSTGATSGQSITFDGTNVVWGNGITVAVVGYSRTAVSTTYTATTTDNIVACNTTGGAFTVTLPLANSVASGHVVIIKDEGLDANANNITIIRQGADLIGANTGFVTSQSITLKGGLNRYYSDGVSNWFLW